MNHSNEPTPVIENRPSAPKKDYRNLVIGSMAVIILGLGAWLVYANSTTARRMDAQQEALATTNAEKSNVQTNFDASLARLDSLSGSNTELGNELKAKNDEIARIKEEIRTILNKQNVTSEELARAKSLITRLNGQISDLKQEVARLRSENKYLSDTLAATTVIKQELEKKVDVASTLNASNIVITPVKIKSNGKEKVSTSARKVDKMVISFDVSNRIVQPGTTDLYVVVVGPDGQQVQGASGSGSFSTREEGDKQYTAKVALDLETAKTKKVAFSVVPAGTFHQGNYKIQIYQNGFLIGEGTRALKRGGLFG